MATVYDGAVPPGVVVQPPEASPLRTGVTFWVPAEATPSPYVCTGARVYVPPASVGSLPTTVTFRMYTDASLWRAAGLAATKEATIGAGGWVDAVWDTPITMTPGSPYWVVVQFPNNAYITCDQPSDDEKVGSDGFIRLTAHDNHANNPSFHRAGYAYNTDEGVSPLQWGQDIYAVDIITNGEASAPEPVQLATPVVTVTGTTAVTEAGGDGTITATWPAVPDAVSYEAGIATGADQTTGFVSTGPATSPHTWTGLAAGTYTVAVRALPEA